MSTKEKIPTKLGNHKQSKETIDMTNKTTFETLMKPHDVELPRIVLWTIENPSGTVDQCVKATGYSHLAVEHLITIPEFFSAVEALYMWSEPKLVQYGHFLLPPKKHDPAE